MDKAFFCHSGPEANETALKLARFHGHKNPQFIAMSGAFHGRTSLFLVLPVARMRRKTIRILPALNITDTEFSFLIGRLIRSISHFLALKPE